MSGWLVVKLLLLVCVWLTQSSVCGQDAEPAPETKDPVEEEPTKPATPVEDFLTEKGLHHKWVRQVTELEDGTTITNGGYVHLEMGLHYKDEAGVLKEAKERIVLTPDGAEASETQIKVKFAPDILTAGAIDIRTPDGVRLRGAPLGLAYYDAKSGQSVLLAEARSTIGELQPPNRLVYKDFLDDVMADAVYEISKAGVMQLILIKEKLPPPSEFGLGDETTRLEVLTEFLDAPQPEKTTTVLKGETNEVKRAEMVDPDLKDTTLRFGNAIMPRGAAFGVTLDQKDPSKEEPVGKTWHHFPEEGRSVLFESVEYAPISESFKELPANEKPREQALVPREIRRIPAKRVAMATVSRIQVANVTYRLDGTAIDFTIASGGGTMIFLSGTTYLIESTITPSTATFHRGCVVKFGKGGVAGPPSIRISGNVSFPGTTGETIFTAVDDDLYGEVIQGSDATGVTPSATSSGKPDNHYADVALDIQYLSQGFSLENFRVRFARVGIRIPSSSYIGSLNAGRFESCRIGVQLDNGSKGSLSNLEFCGVMQTVSGVPYSQAGLSISCANTFFVISKTEKLIIASHEGVGVNYRAALAIDGHIGNTNQAWASLRPNATSGVGEWISIDLQKNRRVQVINYYGAGVGNFDGYRIWVLSQAAAPNPNDAAANWGGVAASVASGSWTWPASTMMQTAAIQPPSGSVGRHVILYCDAIDEANAWAAELWFYGNQLPTVSTVTSQTVPRNTPTGSLGFAIDDAETLAGNLSVTAVSTDTAVVANSGISISGTGSTRNVMVTPLANASGVTTIILRATDEDGGFTESAFTLTVNDAPNVTLPTNPGPTFTEEGSPVVLEASATVTVVDSSNFAGGNLTASVTGNGHANDRLALGAVGSITVDVSNNVKHGATTIGTVSGGVGTGALVVALNAQATPARVQDLLRSVQFYNVDTGNPSTLLRTVTVTVNDGDGGTSTPVFKTVSVSASNDAPVLTSVNTLIGASEDTDFTITHAMMLAATEATLTDVDNAVNSLQFRVETVSAGTLKQNGNPVTLGVSLLGSSTPSWVWRAPADANQNIAAFTVVAYDGSAQSTTPRTVTITVSPVNDAPVLQSFGADISYTENGAAVAISGGASGVTVADVDTPVLNGGQLTVDYAAAGLAEDRLTIPNQGSGAGQIGVVGTDVRYGGTSLGAIAPGYSGVGTEALRVNLNSGANLAAVQALARSITYHNASENPSTAPRTVRMQVTDGAGGTSGQPSKTITVAGGNDAPTIAGPILSQLIQENTSTGVLNFTVGDAETAAGSLIVTVLSSSDTTIIPVGNVALGGGGANRTVQVTPAPNKAGPAVTITLRVSDGALTANMSFLVTVNAKPVISTILNQTITQGVTIGPVNFTVADAETAAGSLVVTKSVAGDTTLVPPANVVLGGAEGARSVTITTAANRFGSAQVTLTVDDGNGGTASTSFNVFVLVPPTFSHAGGVYHHDLAVEITAPAGGELKVRQASPSMNLLNTGTWQASSGASPVGFPKYGLGEENSIQARSTPYGTTELVWVGQNTDGGGSNGDGGWKSGNVPIDTTKLYRFSVWIKKSGPTGPAGGRAYLGLQANRVATISSAGSATHPYFWFGDNLPADQWHLVFGFVHPYGHTGTTSYGAVYNTHGQFVFAGTDYEWNSGVVNAPHWSFMDTATSIFAGVELWNPRIEQVNSVSDSVDVLTATREAGPKTILLTGNLNNTIQAATATATLASAVDTRTYTFQAADPTAILAEGTGPDDVNVTLDCVTGGTEIRVTTDGSEPTELSALCSAPLNVTSGTTIKARAFKANYHPSATVSTVATRYAAPVFSLPSGTYYNDISVSVQAPSGAQLKVLAQGLNLVNPGNWVLGSEGSQPSFPAYGTAAAENKIETRSTPYATSENVWTAYNLESATGGLNNQDGGWLGDSFTIDTLKRYRFSVWVKKTGSVASPSSGKTYLAARQGSLMTLAAPGVTPPPAPFFWNGYLPSQDWHLIVGFVHPSGYSATSPIYSGLYSSQGALLSVGIKDDFRWAPPPPPSTASTTSHRAYLDSATDTSVQHQFWNPRLEQVDDPLAPVDVLFVSPVTSPQNLNLADNSQSTVRARSVGASGIPSAVATASYVFKAATPTATVTPVSGGASVQIALATATGGSATIRYTTSGNEPTATTGTLYSSPFTTSANTVVKFKAFRNNYLPSDTGTYQGIADTDYDGRSNVQELLDGTSPNNPASVLPVLLGQWKFELATLEGEQGQLPVNPQNVTRVASLYGNALSHSASGNGQIKYKEIEDNNKANINLREGTIRFLFRPTWGSTNDFSVGPGGEGRLVTVGQYSADASYGEWSLAVTADGSHVFLRTQANGVSTTNLFCPISWAPGQWHEVALTYDASTTKLFIDGDPAATGSGIANIPAAGVRSAGFWIGSDHLGQQKALGEFDTLETYNYVRTPSAVVSAFSTTLPTLANQAPVVKAAQDFIVAQPNQPVTLVWNASDDGPVAPYGYVFTTPIGATITEVIPPGHQWVITYATSFSVPGTYRFSVALNDAIGYGRDRITVVVPAPGDNTPPIVNLRPNPIAHATCSEVLLFAHPDPNIGSWVRDIDNPTLAGGWLKLWCQTGDWNGDDQFGFAPWSHLFEVEGNSITDNDVPVGTISGAGSVAAPYTVTFTANTTPGHVSRMLMFMTYRHNAATQTAGERLINVSVSDGTPQGETIRPFRLSVVPDVSAPKVDAGPDQTIEPTAFPATAQLIGLVSDVVMRNGSCREIGWSQVSSSSGGSTTFVPPNNSSAVTASFSQPGIYVLRLTVTAAGVTKTDDVEVEVTNQVNVAPKVDVEPEYQAIAYGTSPAFTLTSVVDDAIPSGTPAKLWEAVSGAEHTTIQSPNAPNPGVSFSKPGTYSLRLTATEVGGSPNLSGSDVVTVEVLPDNAANQPPKVFAGFSRSIKKANSGSTSIPLEGVVIDDGLPNNSPLAVAWICVEKPVGATANFSDVNSPTAIVSLDSPGRYKLTLSAQEGSSTPVTDEVTFWVTTNARRPKNVILLVDESKSTVAGGARNGELRAAEFVDFLEPGVDRAGLVLFAWERAWIQHALSSDLMSVRNATSPINETIHDGSSTEIGIALAIQELTGPRQNDNADKIIIVLGDGVAGSPEGPNLALQARAAGIAVFSIGIFTGNEEGVYSTISQDWENYLKSLTLNDLYEQATYRYYQLRISPATKAATRMDVGPAAKAIYESVAQEIYLGEEFDRIRFGVFAGSEKTVIPGGSQTFNGTVGGTGGFSYSWQTKYGNNVAIHTPGALATATTFNGTAGLYVLRLNVTDSGVPAIVDYDDVLVHVTRDPVDDYVWIPQDGVGHLIRVLDNDPSSSSWLIENAGSAIGDQAIYSSVDENGLGLGPKRQFRYQAKSSNSGIAHRITYSIQTDLESKPAQLYVIVDPINRPPVAFDDDNTVFSFSPGGVSKSLTASPRNVLINDFDPDAAEQLDEALNDPTFWTLYPFQLVSVTQATKNPGTVGGLNTGALVLSGPHALDYTPPPLPVGNEPLFKGSVSFNYTIRDSYGRTATARTKLYVSPAADELLFKASDDYYYFDAGEQSRDLFILANDKDIGDTEAGDFFDIDTMPPSGLTATKHHTGNNYSVIQFDTHGQLPDQPVTFTYRLFNTTKPEHRASVHIGFKQSANEMHEEGGYGGQLLTIGGEELNAADGPPILRKGVVTVTGSVFDNISSHLVRYALRVYKFDSDEEVVEKLYVGRVAAGDDLGELNLAGLADGTYRLNLVVSDDGNLDAGGGPDDWAYFTLKSDLKIGRLRFAQDDLEIAVEGLPLKVSRLYDTDDAEGGDFGPGWRLSVAGARLIKRDSLGRYWGADGNNAYNDGRQYVIVDLGNGERFEFHPSVLSLPIFDGSSFTFAPVATTATLSMTPTPSMINPPSQFYVIGDTENPEDRAIHDDVMNPPFDWNDFTFKHPDGGIYTFSGGRLTKVVDRNLNEIVFEMDGQGDDKIETKKKTAIESQETAKKSVVIRRDAAHRITEIFGPGEPTTGVPTLKYRYAAEEGGSVEHLVQVERLVDKSTPNNPKYESTHFSYVANDSSHPKHFLSHLRDSLGQISRYEYDGKGRLSASVDGVGTKASFDYHDDVDPEALFGKEFGAKGRQTIRDNFGNETVHEYDAHGNIVCTQDPLKNVTKTTYTYDASDRLESQISVKYKTVETQVNNQTQVTLVEVERSPVTQFAYYPNSDTVATITVAVSGVTTGSQTFDTFGNLLSSTDALDLTTTYAYVGVNENPATDYVNAIGKLKSVTLPSVNGQPSVTTYTYPANKIIETDALGNRTTTVLHPDFGWTTSVLRQQANPNKVLSLVRYSYDGEGRVLTETTRREMPGETDPSGTVYERLIKTFTYDAAGRLLSTAASTQKIGVAVDGITETDIDPPAPVLNAFPTMTYNARGQVETETRVRTPLTGPAETQTTRSEYDAAGHLIRKTYPDNRFEAWNYVGGRLDHQVDRAGRVTRYFYDVLGRVTKTLLPDETETKRLTEFDAAGRVSRTFDGRGNATGFGYDTQGRRTSVTNAVGEVTSYTYYADGALDTTKDERKNRITQKNHYDTRGRLAKVVQPGEVTQWYQYDALDRRTAEIGADETTQGSRQVAGFTYDGLGRLVAVRNSVYAFDKNTGVLGGEDSATVAITKYSYDEAGNQLTQEDAEGRITNYRYDAFGRRTQRRLPLSSGSSFVESMVYNELGALKKRTDFKGGIVNFEYDVMNRLVKKVPGAAVTGAAAAEFTYTATGQRATMKYPVTYPPSQTPVTEEVSYGYDGADRLLSKLTPQGKIVYTYDPAGGLESMKTFHGTTPSLQVEYKRDALNRVTQVIDNTTGSPLITSYDYDQRDLLIQRLPNGLVVETQLNALGHIDRIDHTRPGVSAFRAYFQYNKRPSGLREGMAEQIAGLQERSLSWTYDPVNRLAAEGITANGAGTIVRTGSIRYDDAWGYNDSTGYDKVGNRRQRIVSLSSSAPGLPNGTQTWNYDPHDRLDNDTSSANGTPWFDDNGNTETAPETSTITFDYDYADRLEKRKVNGTVTTRIIYDGDGQRIFKNASGVMTYYLMDDRNPTGYAQVLEETATLNGPARAIYIYGTDLINQHRKPATDWITHYYGYDGLGSTRFLTDDAGTITDTYTYDAFGNLLDRTARHTTTGAQIAFTDPSTENAPSGTTPTPNNYRFAGEYYDADLSTYHLRARTYNPALGRFPTMDIYEGGQSDPLSLHKYLYAHSNPANNIDPSGMATEGSAGQVVTIGSIGHLAARGGLAIGRASGWAVRRANVAALRGAQFYLANEGYIILGSFLAPPVILAGLDALANNQQTVPPGNFPRGRMAETTFGVNLGGNFPVIDHWDPDSGMAISVRSHSLANPANWEQTVLNDMDELRDGIKRPLQGHPAGNPAVRVNVNPGEVNSTYLVEIVTEGELENQRATGALARIQAQARNIRVLVVTWKGFKR